MATQNNKKGIGKFFRFFDYNRDNRLDALQEDTTPNVRRYFKLLGRRFWKLITLNLMMLPLLLPVLVAIYLYFSLEQTPTANNIIFPQLYGASIAAPSTHSTFLLDLFGAQMDIPIMGVGAYVGIGICALFLLITLGWQNVGATYVLRNMVRGEAVFLWSDYFYAIKRNLRPAFFLGLIDGLIIFLLGFDIMYFWNQTGDFWTDVFFFAIFALIVLYFFMRFYIYLLLVTFDLSIKKIFKNALIFTMLGIKRNLMGLLGIALITAINVGLFFVFAATPLGIAIPLILPLFYYLAVTAFTSTYCAYPIIERYMITPYAKKVTVTEEDAQASALESGEE